MTRIVLALALLVAACGEREINGTACSSATDCNLFNVQGTCETTGFCSYPDGVCLSGQRYAPGAGDALANTCVGDASCGGKDQACCAATVCADNLVCAGADTAAMSCQCGGADQPCCDGITCETGRHCGNGATCSTSDVMQVAVGAGHTCAWLADDSVWCWGADVRGLTMRPNVGTATFSYERPTKILDASNVAELRGGEFHTCVKKTDGTLWCWGHNDSGQLGDGTQIAKEAATQVSGLSAVTLFSVGRKSTCAVGTFAGNTRLYCWGRGGVQSRTAMTPLGGRLGDGTTNDSSSPVAVDLSQAAATGQTVKALSVGGYHTCIVMSDDKVWCWGRNDNGQLGDGTVTYSKVPVQVVLSGVTIPAGVTIDEVSCGDGRRKQSSSCMRLSDGAMYCWGYNTNGDLGDGLTAQRTAPSLPVVTTDFGTAKPTALASAAHLHCARMDSGEVFCWGQNIRGSIPTGGADRANFLTPQKLPVTGITRIDASHHTACVIDGMKQLYCWGTNRSGNAMGRFPTTMAEDSVLTPFHIVF